MNHFKRIRYTIYTMDATTKLLDSNVKELLSQVAILSLTVSSIQLRIKEIESVLRSSIKKPDVAKLSNVPNKLCIDDSESEGYDSDQNSPATISYKKISTNSNSDSEGYDSELDKPCVESPAFDIDVIKSKKSKYVIVSDADIGDISDAESGYESE